MRPGSVTSLPVSTASTGLLCLLVGTHLHCGRSITKVSMWLLPRAFHIRCMTILGVPGWAPTDDMQPELWAKARLGCDLSHQVWIVRTSGKGNTLLYQRVFPLDSYVCEGWCSMCYDISRRKGWIGIITLSHCALP